MWQKIFYSLLLSFLATVSFGHQIRGSVTNDEGKPIIGASLYVKGTTYGVLTNHKGEFAIELDDGTYVLVVRSLGYQNQEISINVADQNLRLDVTLKTEITELEKVIVTESERDLAKEIMKKVVANRRKYLRQYETYKCTTYIKAALEQETKTTEKDSITREKTVTKSKEKMNLIESMAETYHQSPSRFKDVVFAYMNHTDKPKTFGINATVSAYGLYVEERSAYDATGYYESNPYLFYTSTSEADFNFYRNQIKVDKISDQSLISPLGSSAMITYKFRHVESFFEDDLYIHKIEVEPRNSSGATFSGYIFIVDGEWSLKAVELAINKRVINSYHDFKVLQNHEKTPDSVWAMKRQEFYYEVWQDEGLLIGNTQAIYQDYEFDPQLEAKTFDGALSVVNEDALEKGRDYWANLRPVTLKVEEETFIIEQDSIRQHFESPEYLASQDSSYNHTGIADILFTGVGYRSSLKGYSLYIFPVIMQVRPFSVGGYRHSIGGSYARDLNDGRRLDVDGFVDYGFRIRDVRGQVSVGYRFDPLKFKRLVVGAGSNYEIVNPFEGVVSNLNPGNFVLADHVKIGYEQEIKNGLFFKSLLKYSHQDPIDNDLVAPWLKEYFDTLKATAGIEDDPSYSSETPQFDPYTKLELTTRVNIRFKQEYYTRPGRKYIMGSKYPKVDLLWRFGIPKVFGSDVGYNFLKATVHDDFWLGSLGVSKYEISVGSFIGNARLRPIDRQFFTGTDYFWFTNPMTSFQFLGPTLSTTQPYLEARYMHRFNGAFLNKIPIIKRLRLQTMGGANALLIPNDDIAHFEAYVGLEKPFRLFGVMWKYGLYQNVSFGNVSGFPTLLKFGMDFFNPVTGKWSF